MRGTLEVKGKTKIKDIKAIGDKFKINEPVKVKSIVSTRKFEIVEGTVIQKTDALVAIKTNNYVKSFKYKDFLTKTSVII